MSSLPEHAPTPPRDAAEVRPGWPEIVVGVGVFLIVAFGVPPLMRQAGLDPAVDGLLLAALSGVAGLAGLAAATAIRIRSLPPFGLRRTTPRWLLIGVAAGLLAWIVSRLVFALVVLVAGQPENVQAPYTEAGSAGPVFLVVSLIFLAGLTPLGEELLFRGVVATALLRYGVLAGVVGSSLIFAAVHGFNAVLLTAFVNGIVGAELLRRSGSVWPAVLSHVVNNGIAQLLAVLLVAS